MSVRQSIRLVAIASKTKGTSVDQAINNENKVQISYSYKQLSIFKDIIPIYEPSRL